MRLLTVGLTPAVQRVMVFDRLAPADVNRAADTRVCPAGKSVNAARAARIASPGLEIHAASVQGHLTGQFCNDAMAKMNVVPRGPQSAHETRTCVTVIDRAAGTTTELVQESLELSETILDLMIAAIANDAFDALLCAGSLTPRADPGFYARVLLAHPDVPALVDAKGEPLMLAIGSQRRGAKIAKLNAEELRQTTNAQDIPSGIEALLGAGATGALITDGPRAAHAAFGKDRKTFAPPKVNVLNTTGCGDCVAGAFSARWLAQGDFFAAARYALAASAASAETLLPSDFNPERADELVPQVAVSE